MVSTPAPHLTELCRDEAACPQLARALPITLAAVAAARCAGEADANTGADAPGGLGARGRAGLRSDQRLADGPADAPWRAACRGHDSRNRRYTFNLRQADNEPGGIRNARLFAAACLFRLTGGASYNTIVVNQLSPADWQHMACWAAYEYVLCGQPTADAAKQAALIAAMQAWATTRASPPAGAAVGMRSMRFAGFGTGFGYDGCDWAFTSDVVTCLFNIREAQSPGSGSAYRKILEEGFGYILGANQTRRSFVTGLGKQRVRSCLHNDSQALGVDPPSGICVYGPGRRNGLRSMAFKQSFINGLPLGLTATDITQNGYFRQIHPSPFAWPQREHFFEHYAMIEMSEYVIGAVGRQAWAAMSLWGAQQLPARTSLNDYVPQGRARATIRCS